MRNSKEVADWVAAENKVTSGYLEAIPQREKIRNRLTELWNFAQYSGAMKEGGRYYYFKNDGLQNQPVLYRLDSLDGEPKVLIDPNTWSKDGTIALQGLSFSDDGKYVGLQPCRSRLRLGHLVCDGNRIGQTAARRTQMDQVHQSRLDKRRPGIFL